MLKSPDVSVSARPAPWSPFCLARLVLPLIIGSFVCLMLMWLLAAHAPSAQAAPPARPMAVIITDTISVVHTSNTTHQMRVFADGSLSDQFLNDDGQNQIDQDGGDPRATTIAVLFDQHPTTHTVDVGVQGDFRPTTPISLQTASTIPGYSEDTYVVYASQVLAYQVTQQTLATTTNNCVVMKLTVLNTSGSVTLTGGILLYMLDIDVAKTQAGDLGVYDPTRHLVYQKDSNGPGYALGISLLEGGWRGYGVNGTNRYSYFSPPPAAESYPTLDAGIKREMITPSNTIVNGNNDVTWLVANVPDLNPGQAATLAFGICARTDPGGDEDLAAINMLGSFDKVAKLSVAKTATPAGGSTVAAGELITYQVAISSTGCWPADNIVVTDAVPASADLIAYSTSQGSITASNRLVTASVGSLAASSGTVTVTLVVRPAITSTDGAILSNRAFVKSEPIVTNTNVVTHRIANVPVLTVTKRADPGPAVGPGERLTYTIAISNSGQGYASGVVISDALPANTQFVDGSIGLTPSDAGIAGTVPPALATGVVIPPGQSVTVTLAVTVNTPLTAGMIITNTAAVTRTGWATPTTATVTSTVRSADLAIGKRSNPVPAVPGTVLTYTITVSNVGQTHMVGAGVSDTIPAAISGVSWTCAASSGSSCITPSGSGAISNTVNLRSGGTITYTVTGTLAASATATLVNTASVAVPAGITDLVTANNVATDTNTPAPRADLALSKAATPGRIVPGQPVTYTLVYTNYGPRTAANGLITDIVPVMLTGISYISSGAQVTPTGSLSYTWQVADLAPGAGGIITITGVVGPGLITDTSFVNNASITSTTFDAVPANNADSTTTAVILPRVSFGSPTYSVDEGAGPAVITVTLDTAPFIPVMVDYATSNGTATAPGDYTAASGTLTFAVGQTSRTFTVTVVNDTLDEGDESVTVTLNNPGNTSLGTPNSATLTIVDDDALPAVQFSSAGYSVGEATGTATITVTLSAASGRAVTVDYATGNGTAVAPADYITTSGTLTFTVGQTSRTFTVTAVNDTLEEGDETVILTLSNPGNVSLGATNPATLTIVDDDVVTLSTHKDSADATGAPLFPADILIYTVTVTNPAAASQTNVVIADSVPTSTTLVAGSAQSNADEVSIVGDAIIARLDTLGPGQVFTLTFRVTVDLGTGGATIANQAHVASDQQPNPPQPPPTADVVTTPAPGLALSKWAAPGSGSDDSWTQYHFLVTNTGNMPLTDIQIWDDHLSPTIGSFGVPDLPAGGTYSVRRWWPMNADVTNVATVTARALGFPDLLSASDDAFFDVIHSLNLAFDVSVEPEVIPEAQTVTYTYRLTNIGTDWMVGGTITDTQWGVIAGGLELAPGAAYTQIATQWIATTTANAARAGGFNLLGIGASAIDSATVTVGTPADYAHTLYLPIIMRNH